MKNLWTLIGYFCLALGVSHSAAEEKATDCPKTFDRPFFASAEELPDSVEGLERVLGPGGSEYLADTLTGLQPEEYERSGLSLKEFLRTRSDARAGCIPLELVLPHSATTNRSFEDLFGASEHVVLGTVEQATPGFHRELPGSLLKIRIQEQFKGVESQDSIQLFYLGGSFELWGLDFCSKINGTSEVPLVGSSLVVFYEPSWRGTLCPVVAPQASAWMLDTERRRVQADASHHGRLMEMTPDELVHQLRALKTASP